MGCTIGALIDWLPVSRTRASQVRVLLLGWLGGWRTEPGCCLVNVLPFPCRMSRPGQAEVTRSSFPQLSWLDFAWLMNCDETQLQGCLPSFFFFLQQNFKRAKTGVRKPHWWLLTFTSAAATDTLHWTPEGPPPSGCKTCTLYSQLLMFQCKRGANNVTDLPGHAAAHTPWSESALWLQTTERSHSWEVVSQINPERGSGRDVPCLWGDW